MDDSSLSLWMRALIGYVRSGSPDLTNRQMALLMLVYLTPGPHTVRGLARAVAQACGANPVAVVVPCHRVVMSDGSIGGYSGLPGVKKALLEAEGALPA